MGGERIPAWLVSLTRQGCWKGELRDPVAVGLGLVVSLVFGGDLEREGFAVLEGVASVEADAGGCRRL
jgi:hypothetical protein